MTPLQTRSLSQPLAGARRLRWLTVTLAVTGIAGVATWWILRLCAIARRGAPTWPTGDGAMIELYTIHAAQATQFLGPYSQYGWHHPGPMLFYLLVPFYVVTVHSALGLNAAALVINVVSLALVGWQATRRTDAASPFVIALCILITLYLARLPELLTSVWNPHVALLPFAALMMLAAAGMSGDVRVLPLMAIVASFVSQTHVGFVPVSAALVLSTIVALGIQAWSRPKRRRALERWGVLAIAVAQILWILPVSEQLQSTPGNMTSIWRFFVNGDPGPPAMDAWRAWSSMLVGAVRPDFELAYGGVFTGSSSGWPIAASVVLMTALGAVAVSGWRARRFAECALAGTCFLSASVGLWSVLHIHGTIGDYQIFWLSLVGLVSTATIAAAGIRAGLRRPLRRPVDVSIARGAAVLMVIGAATAGHAWLTEMAAGGTPLAESVVVRDLTEQIFHVMPATGGRRPLIRIDAGMWRVVPGILVQMSRAAVPFTLDPDQALFFGDQWLTTGREDLLLTICGPALHRELSARPGNVILAHEEDRAGAVFVDGISLVDAPQYRRR